MRTISGSGSAAAFLRSPSRTAGASLASRAEEPPNNHLSMPAMIRPEIPALSQGLLKTGLLQSL